VEVSWSFWNTLTNVLSGRSYCTHSPFVLGPYKGRTYFEPPYLSFKDTPKVRMHLGEYSWKLRHLVLMIRDCDACIGMIRLTIMCNADVAMMTWDCVKGEREDFGLCYQA
jgi:hypothetical protein